MVMGDIKKGLSGQVALLTQEQSDCQRALLPKVGRRYVCLCGQVVPSSGKASCLALAAGSATLGSVS